MENRRKHYPENSFGRLYTVGKYVYEFIYTYKYIYTMQFSASQNICMAYRASRNSIFYKSTLKLFEWLWDFPEPLSDNFAVQQVWTDMHLQIWHKLTLIWFV